MEKLLYPVWKDPSLTGDAVSRETAAPAGAEAGRPEGVHGLRICVADSAVAAASKRRIESQAPVPDAMLSLWVDFAGAAAHWEPLIDAHVSHKTAYLVAEAEPLVNQERHPSTAGRAGLRHVPRGVYVRARGYGA